MAKLQHVAIVVRDPQQAAAFYQYVFGMKIMEQSDTVCSVSDGNVSLLFFRTSSQELLGKEYDLNYQGLHHIGFKVDDFEHTARRIDEAGYKARDDLNQAVAAIVGPHAKSVEHKYRGPADVTFDISEKGWPL